MYRNDNLNIVNRNPLVIEDNAYLSMEEEWWDVDFDSIINHDEDPDAFWRGGDGLSIRIVRHFTDLGVREWVERFPLGRVRVTVELLDDNGGAE